MTLAREQGYDFSRIDGKSSLPQPAQGTVYFIIYRKHGAVVADTPFFSQLAQGIDSGCKKHHYYLNVFYLDEIYDAGAKTRTVLADVTEYG
jgi:LacI family transcriptional regulator